MASGVAGAGAAVLVTQAVGGVAATNVQAAIAELDSEKANLASPALTGNPTAPTPSLGDNDTSIATTAFVTAAIDAAPKPVGSVLYLSTYFGGF